MNNYDCIAIVSNVLHVIAPTLCLENSVDILSCQDKIFYLDAWSWLTCQVTKTTKHALTQSAKQVNNELQVFFRQYYYSIVKKKTFATEKVRLSCST